MSLSLAPVNIGQVHWTPAGDFSRSGTPSRPTTEPLVYRSDNADMQTLERDDAVILQPEDRALASVIWLHGLGADGYDFLPIVPELGVDDLSIRFVFPHAPIRAVTINNGNRMRAWYDILSLTRPAEEDAAGIRSSAMLVQDFLRVERERGLAEDRIVLAGFSQGGAIALHTGLRHAHPLAGILALSTYLPLWDSLSVERTEANQHTPILMCHGLQDPVVPLALGEASRDHLRSLGYAVKWHDYPMEHQVCVDEIHTISDWLRDRLG